MFDIYTNTCESESLDKFVIGRGYSKNTLQLIAIIYRKKIKIENIKKIQIILNYQEEAIILQNDTSCETLKVESLCVIHIKYNGEILFMIVKSLPNAKHIQCYLLKFSNYADVTRINSFVKVQCRAMYSIPNYSSTLFPCDLTLSKPLNSIMINFEVDEAMILNIKTIYSNQKLSESFPKNIIADEINDESKTNIPNFKLYDIYSFANYHQDTSIIECGKPRYQSSIKTNQIFLLITTDYSIQFLDTILKIIIGEIFFVDIKDIIKQTDHMDRVMLIVRNYINNSQYSLESLYIQFTDKNNCKKFFDILCNKAEKQYTCLRLCPKCPLNILSEISDDIHELINDDEVCDFDKIESCYSVHQVNNLIKSYVDKIDDLVFKNILEKNCGIIILTYFEIFLKYYENQQSKHSCNLQGKDKIIPKMSFKIWDNIKNVFTKKLPTDLKFDHTDNENETIAKNDDNQNEKDEFSVKDDNGLQLRRVSSRTRRAISINECILQKPSIFQSLNYNNSTFENLSNKNRRKTFLYATTLLDIKSDQRHFKSFVLVIIASQYLVKISNLKWNYSTNNIEYKIKNYPINNEDIKINFGSNQKLSYSFNTIVKNSYEKVDQEWAIILKNKDAKSSCNKIIKDGVSISQRRKAWKLIMKLSPHLKFETIGKNNLSSDYQLILEQMVQTDIFECSLIKDFYKQSFNKMDRSNSDILNDIGRTMPQISYFGIHYQGQLALFNVLRAYALLDPDVSYCQGMNFIVAIFLLHMNEEEAFTALIFYMVFLERRDIYLPSMIGIKHSFYKLERLLCDFCPALNHHLLDKNFPISLYASSWIMTLFVTVYPLHFVTRVFDLILTEGSSMIYNISITLVSYVADKVLILMDFDLIYEHFCKNLNNLSEDDLIQILHKASEINISRNLKIYDLEITCNMKDNVADNQFIQNLCIENIDLRLENAIFRKCLEAMHKEIMELKISIQRGTIK